MAVKSFRIDASRGLMVAVVGTPSGDATVAARTSDCTDQQFIQAVNEATNLTPSAALYYSDGEIIAAQSQPSRFHTWDWDLLQWSIDLSAVKREKTIDIKASRVRADNSITVTVGGAQFTVDANCRDRLQLLCAGATLALHMNSAFGAVFESSTGAVSLGAVQTLQLAAAVGEQMAANAARETTLCASITSATTLAQLNAIAF